MKYADPIIDEVRAIRDAMVRDNNYDIEQLSKLLKEHEVRGGRRIVRRPPKPVLVEKKAS